MHVALANLELCRPDWPQTHRDLTASASQLLGSKVWVIVPDLRNILKLVRGDQRATCRSLFSLSAMCFLGTEERPYGLVEVP